ncbi:ABC transporter ATP-binding protein [Kiloniella sp.]|uniref:ABC transporter ATP-binding protein n=1 Tax=Kiloniella sp. TaxID=1938587 RepID=UPI003B012CAE
MTLLKRLYSHIDKARRWQFGLLLILILLTTAAEVVSIGSVIPFLGVLSAPEKVFNHHAIQPAIELLEITEPDQLLLPLAAAFAIAAIIAGSMRLLLLIAQTRLSFATGHQLGVNIYQRTLFQPYSIHASRNSSEVINGIYGKAAAVTSGVILPILTLLSGSVMLTTIMIALLLVEPVAALTAFGGFGIIYATIIGLTRKQLSSDGKRVAQQSSDVIKSLQEGLGGIRDVLIHGSQNTYCNAYRQADHGLRRAQGNTVIIAQSPRFLMEALGILLMTILAYTLTRQSEGLIGAIPILGSLALGAQRLLPVLQQGYQSWSSIRASQTSLIDTLELLDQPLPEYATSPTRPPLPFTSSIQLKKVSFQYTSQDDWVVQSVDLEIPKGSRVGFIGATGSGKSTIIDILMGLLEPTEGSLEIDGTQLNRENQQAWQQLLAHVPQTIFLADCTIAENIAFGLPKTQIDQARVQEAARQAQISVAIDSWKDGYQTIVGERGIRLSGGQRQRIGIARALYRKASVIVFDEATSALDNETEEAVMEAIDGLSHDLTIILIAHRYSTLRSCNEIIEVKEGKINSVGSYRDFYKQTMKNTQIGLK